MKQLLLFVLFIFLSISVYSQIGGPPPPCGYFVEYSCDDNDDGFAEFNLVELFPFDTFCREDKGSAEDYYPIAYYETQEDMNSETNPIVNPENYTNISNPQTIYYRANKIVPDNIVYLTAENLMEVKRLAYSIPDYEQYGTAQGETVDFDLTSVNVFCGGNSSANYTVTYYASQTDANSGINPIATPSSYPISDFQDIYVRAEHNSTAYVETTSFVIRVLLAEANTPANFIFCDNDFDGLLDVNLTYYDTEILGNQSPNDFTVSYYLTLFDAENNTNQLPSVYNVSNSVTIYAKVYENSMGSYAITSFDISILIPPSINQPTNLEVCDDESEDGIETFDLSSKHEEISNGQKDVSISYYLILADAESSVNALPVLYTSSSSYQTIYVRVENVNGCYITTTLELIVNDCGDPDNDGVINSDEDINGNGDLDDDDTDKDGIPDYKDDDDDGDKIDTADELIDQSNVTGKTSKSSKIARTFIDTDSDTFENYLDDDDDGDGILTKDEDYNNNGTPLDDDTNSNNIPDYLEMSVALEVNKIEVSSFLIFPNPASNLLELKFNKSLSNVVNVCIYDIQGKLILDSKKELKNKSVQLNISNLKRGMYFLKIIEDNYEVTKKLIKE